MEKAQSQMVGTAIAESVPTVTDSLLDSELLLVGGGCAEATPY
jgi:hypothetical protein